MSIDEIEFRNIYKDLIMFGIKTSPRSLLTIECEDFSYKLSPYVRFVNFEARNFNLDYVKHELLWYLSGDKYNISIVKYAKMWKSLINEDGSINSNYGQYIFCGSDNLFDKCIETLKNDKDSRRAIIPILNRNHLFIKTLDIPCTIAINFRIRKNILNMSVMMRSQDSVFGMTNDIPCFSFIHEMLLKSLQPYYPKLELGYYYHYTNSFHVYERHFKMVESIITGSKYTKIECPRILNKEEVDFLRKCDYSEIPDEFQFTKWLNNV